MSTWFRRVWHLINRPRFERELTREMREHREMMHDPIDVRRFASPARALARCLGVELAGRCAAGSSAGGAGLRGRRRLRVTAILILIVRHRAEPHLFQMANVVLLRRPAISHPETLARLHRHGRLRANSEACPMWLHSGSRATTRRCRRCWSKPRHRSSGVRSRSVVETSFVSPNWFAELGSGPSPDACSFRSLTARRRAADGYRQLRLLANRSLAPIPRRLAQRCTFNDRPVTLIGVMPKACSGIWT